MTTTDDIRTGELFAATINGVTVVAMCTLNTDNWINYTLVSGWECVRHPAELHHIEVTDVTWAWGNLLAEGIFEDAVHACRAIYRAQRAHSGSLIGDKLQLARATAKPQTIFDFCIKHLEKFHPQAAPGCNWCTAVNRAAESVPIPA